MPLLNIAHRGFSGKYPENTMLAFEKAVEEGHCDGFETDVHLSADGEMVIIHDEQVDRTTNGTGGVDKMTYAELRKLDAGQGERIPRLADVLELAKKHDRILNIELKNMPNPYPGLEEKVIALVRKMDMVEQVQFSSFNHVSMALCKRLAPEFYTALLYAQPLYRAWEYAALCGANALNAYYPLAYYQPDLVAQSMDAGIDLNMWTVDEAADMEKLRKLIGRGSIITNRPDRMLIQ